MADAPEEDWTVMHRGRVVGVITVREADFPWLSGGWTPTDEFVELAPLFERELALLQPDIADVTEWESAYAPIREAVRLHRPGGTGVAQFLLHIDGSDAWFWWSDEPFE